jgi:hypothetical protein
MTMTSADGSQLAMNHEPALEEWERHDRSRVCDPLRIELLCAACHAAAPSSLGG